MRVIHKYRISVLDGNNYTVGNNPVFRHFGYDGNRDMCVWIEEDAGHKIYTYHLHIIGTGEKFDGVEMRYLATLISDDGYVWHLYTTSW